MDVTEWKVSGKQRASVAGVKRPLLKRTEQEKPKEFNMGVFDIETDGLGGDFIIGCISSEIGDYTYVYNVKDLLQELLRYKGYIMYAHNGAKFDFLYIAEEIKELRHTYNIAVTRQGDKIIGFSIEDKQDAEERMLKRKAHGKEDVKVVKRQGPLAIQLRDSLPLLNTSLYGATKSFSPELMKLKGDVDFEGGEKFNPQDPKHMSYLHRDCDGLLATMRRFYDVCYDMFHVYPSWTAGGTAMKAWKCTIPEGHCYSSFKERRKENFIREAYYGGYVFPGTDIDIHQEVTSVDYNAAYAASMLEGVPVGGGVWTGTFSSKPGFYRVKVTAPKETYFPCIGKHTEQGLLWPMGTFETHCGTEEIEYAQTKGYTFEVLEGIVFDKIEFPFDAFVAMCQEIETTIDPTTGKVDPARKNIAKQLRNSLYGKFCMRREVETVVISDEIPEGATFIYLQGSSMPIEGMYIIKEENDADYLLPHWGAYITLRQRLRLFKGMDAVKTPFYCDTDSIKAPKALVDAAIEDGKLQVNQTLYGCVKNEGTYEWFQVLAPKTYHGDITEDGEKHHHIKAKGAPQREVNKLVVCPLCEAAEGIYHEIHFTSMHSLQKTLQDSKAPLNEIRKRRISNIQNSYAWTLDTKTNKLHPITLNEF